MSSRRGEIDPAGDHGSLHSIFVAGCWYPDDTDPVQGIFIRRHAEAVALHHRVTVLRPWPSAHGPRTPKVQWREHGAVREAYVEFRGRATPGDGATGSQLGYFRAGLKGCRAVRRTVGSPEIVHFHVVPSVGLTAAVLASFPGAPLVVSEHWSGYLPELNVPLGVLRRIYTGRLTRRAGAVTTVSENLRRVMLDHGFAGAYRVVRNVVDTERFTPRPEPRKGPFRWLHVSTIRPLKQVPAIVRTVLSLLDEGIDVELHVVGEGPDSQRAESLASQAGVLGGAIRFHGRRSEDEVAGHMRDGDGLVLFSDFENSPCVIGEAMACGLPVVAPRVAGIPEMVTAERGVLVAPGDVAALRSAMRSISLGEVCFDRGALRRYAMQAFSPNVIADQFSAIYRECLGHTEAKSSP